MNVRTSLMTKTKCFVCRMDPPWVTKGQGKGNNFHGRGRSSPGSSTAGSSYGSSSNSPIIQRGEMSLVKLKTSQKEASFSLSIHLEDIPEDNPLYAELRAYLTQKEKTDIFASIAKDDIDDIKSYDKGESYKTRSYYETILISIGSAEFQHFSRYNTRKNVYNFSKIIIKQVITIEDWGISSMKERQISLNKIPTSFTYWDYINVFNKVLYYNNERHKHTWFIKVCAKIFAQALPNWFLNQWSYHGPTAKILHDPFLKLYKEWVKVSPNLNNLYHEDHICYFEQIDKIYFFIELSIPWIYKWTPEIGLTKEQIPCLY
ncbi:hypothetical protein H5410_051269 [Solanum commersonii]|uniref:Uncharacterized protein n=1 Tax=Solanum commersonii TaxID=4109 RepID=A0A9J5WXY7_SOLCO|nr:hypothetical protein H5410_051269 [Solanum commersonii]